MTKINMTSLSFLGGELPSTWTCRNQDFNNVN